MRTQKCVQRKQKRDQNTLDEAAFVRDVDKSAYHHLSQNEIAGGNPCSEHLSESECPLGVFRQLSTERLEPKL
jgi:hypothetical protein